MFLLALALGVLIGWGLAMGACGKFIPIWEALAPHHDRRKGVRG